jgi:hypothetical protein
MVAFAAPYRVAWKGIGMSKSKLSLVGAPAPHMSFRQKCDIVFQNGLALFRAPPKTITQVQLLAHHDNVMTLVVEVRHKAIKARKKTLPQFRHVGDGVVMRSTLSELESGLAGED